MKKLYIIILGLVTILYSQSGFEYRRSSVMRGNLVKTVFGNWGVIGQPAQKGARGAWIYENNGYIGDVSLVVGAEVKHDDKTFHSVVVSPVDRPTKQHELSPSGKYWGFEPKAGYFNESQEGIALYSDPASWPLFWPDRMKESDDPGWSGSWNGFFGKQTTAAEESYFVMDDNQDEEFNYANNNNWGVSFKPDENDPTRNGLGLEIKVRGMQWSDFLAQDCIFWLYEITNKSTTDYDKVTFGMLVGTYVGVTSTENYNEYDDDYSFFDVEKDLTYTGDYDDNVKRNPRWTGDVGVVGYAFLESPGNPFDGIDNDGDAKENILVPSTAPLFAPEDFEERMIQAGDKIVLIDPNYERRVVTVPASDTVFQTRGAEITVVPGQTVLAEGNVILRDGRDAINPNAYDGIDNDLDGLIDENYYLHYRQLRKDQQGNVLIDKLRPVAHVDYVTGLGINDALVDERRDDGIDNDGDWDPRFDDVGADGVTGSNDFGEGDGQPTAGEPNFDQTDVDESDQIGLTSFEYFTPARDFSMADDEDLWNRLAPGFFKVPESIVNNKPQRGEDGDFIYGSGYFPLPAGATRRISLALVYGEGGGPEMEISDLLKNRTTVQEIYNNDYRFPPAPNKPILTAVPGDGKVTLYWDRLAERSFDPVLKEFDFEGYKIYRATDNNFNELFSITDADGIPVGYKPIAQFDLDNDLKGYFRAGPDLFQQGRGASYYLGNDSGLEHSYVDTDVENGRRYFYAVVAYDRGDESKDIYPKENDKRIDILPNGQVRTFQNTEMVIPNATVAGYVPPENSVKIEAEQKTGTGTVYYSVLDEEKIADKNYRIEFRDTSNDGIDNNNNWVSPRDDVGSDGIANTQDEDGSELDGLPQRGEPNVDHLDPAEYMVPVTTSYSVSDLTGVVETFFARDTMIINLSNRNLIYSSISLQDRNGGTVPLDRVEIDTVFGKIRGQELGNLLYGEPYTISYKYYPVYKSPYIQKSPYVEETLDSENFDGITLAFNNHWKIDVDTLASGWEDPEKAMGYSFTIIDTYFGSERLLGYKHPADYRIEFFDSIVDSSIEMTKYFVKPIPVNFTIYNQTDQTYIEFIFLDTDRNGKLSPYDELIFVETDAQGNEAFTWDVYFTTTRDTVYDYGSGDALDIVLKKPFRRGDVFEFSTTTPSIDKTAAKQMLKDIKVVPNPYVVATSHERPLPPAITSGRGERKMDFIHLPKSAKIYIYTARGEHVITLEHDSNIHDGTISWNLKSKENLDIAAGIYFYIVESDLGNIDGKLAIIK
ncbi:hypothetical protein GF407_04840 [candidate division KSB1 bacterium]|nr:hypothetical protein [candidate division KSB1 bacterium]